MTYDLLTILGCVLTLAGTAFLWFAYRFWMLSEGH